MEYIQNTLLNLLHQTAFLNLTFGNMIMISGGLHLPVSCDQQRNLSRCLLVPISFGMLLVNIYPDIMLTH